MWNTGIVFGVTVIAYVLADCDNNIHVEGVSWNYGNEIVNGVYVKILPKGCDNRDVFNHTDNGIYLYHIEQGLAGYWMFRDEFDCGNHNIDDGFVRSNDAEFNPGFIQSGWQEKISNGQWQRENAIDVDCYELPKCRYRIDGAANTTLNAFYDVYQSGSYQCEFRDVYKHENIDAYLYFIWSRTQREYFWVVNSKPCVDAVYYGAYLQNDDYSVSPKFIFHIWQERTTDGRYVENPTIGVNCIGGLSPGAIAGIVIGCLAAALIIGAVVWYCVFWDR